MTIYQTDVVDYTAINPKTDEVMLIITDHLGWADEEKPEHMYLLQEKINKYLAFIESGEILEKYPKARGRQIVIRVAMMHPLSDEGARFCDKVRSFLRNA